MVVQIVLNRANLIRIYPLCVCVLCVCVFFYVCMSYTETLVREKVCSVCARHYFLADRADAAL